MHDENPKRSQPGPEEPIEDPCQVPYRRYKVNGREVVLTRAEFEALVEYFRSLQAISLDRPAVIKAETIEKSVGSEGPKSVESGKKVR